MENPNKIRIIAKQKLSDAGYLLQGKRFDNAVYLAGYAVELYLKARIAEVLGHDDLFADSFSNNKLARPYKIHDLEQLLIDSGLNQHYNNQKVNDLNLRLAWEAIIDQNNPTTKWDAKQGTRCPAPLLNSRQISLLIHQLKP